MDNLKLEDFRIKTIKDKTVKCQHGARYLILDTDKSHTNGILKCSHEISITYDIKKDKFYMWHTGVSDYEYNDYDFRELYPGLVKEINDYLNK